MRKLILLFSLLITVVLACKNQEETMAVAPEKVIGVIEPIQIEVDVPQVSMQDTVLFYRRTACFGMCPSFDFIVHRSGDSFYHGRNFVDLIGSYNGKTSQESIIQVFAKANELRYDTLQKTYDNRFVTDLPSIQTEINGKWLTNRYQGPNLEELYNELDSMIARIEWNPNTNNKSNN